MDFDALAAGYDRLRPAGRGWEEVAEHALAAFAARRRLVDIGCGTGRFAVLARRRLGARVWGVDPSAEMLRQARARPDAAGIGWKRATAERMPFRAAWFDAAHMHLVVHALADRPRALAEVARVLGPGGRLAIATFAAEHFDRFFLNPYFPSIRAIDTARFPDPAALAAEIAAAGFADVAVERLSQPVHAAAVDVLERVRGRYISTLHLLDEAELAAGVRALEADVAAGTSGFSYTLEWALFTGTRR